MGLLPQRNVTPACFFLLLFFVAPIRETPQSTILWSAPAILGASLMIAWAAESAQFFIAQGFALAILAWLQTLPEFAVEAVIAWKQQKDLLLANLTGALRLLTGFGWPMIYFTAAMFHRRRNKQPLGSIKLHEHHSVEVVGLLVPLVYIAVIAAKGTLTVFDGAILTVIYAAYLWILSRMPAEEAETIEDLEAIPRAIVTSPRVSRIAIIAALFAGGGALIYFSAEPFLGSLLAISGALGIPRFFFVQWVAPVVSEFPEMASTFYWARTVDRAPMALMNMVSSNINQWTLLTAMLPVVYSMGGGHLQTIVFDNQQRFELLMTLGQALVGMMFLINMELAWWEAAVLFVLFAAAFAHPMVAKIVTVVYFMWAGGELYRMIQGKREPVAMVRFAEIWKRYVSREA
jgi:cation:H+ antiporter